MKRLIATGVLAVLAGVAFAQQPQLSDEAKAAINQAAKQEQSSHLSSLSDRAVELRAQNTLLDGQLRGLAAENERLKKLCGAACEPKKDEKK